MLLLLAGLVGLGFTTAAQPGGAAAGPEFPAGRWAGSAKAEGESTQIVLSLDADGQGIRAVLDLPMMGVEGWPASSVDLTESGAWRVVIPSDSGPQPMILSRDGAGLAGTWRMPGWEQDATVRLDRIGPAPDKGYREEAVRFRSGGLELEGTARVPAGPGPFPSVVFVHGSGALSRAAYRHEAAMLARLGVASLAFDKRGVGASGGDFRTAGFVDLAADARAAVAALASVEGVDPDRIGFVGTSQGGWIAPLAAAGGDVTFLIVVSGPVVSPAQEDKWDVVRRLRQAGFDAEAEAEAMHVMREWDHGIRTGDWSRFIDAREKARSAQWFRASLMHTGATFTADISEEYARWYRGFIDHDPLPVLRRLDIPMLFLYAREDEHIDAMESYSILKREIIAAGRDVSAVVFEGYDHSLRRLGADGTRLRWPERPEGFAHGMASFIHRAGERSGARRPFEWPRPEHSP